LVDKLVQSGANVNACNSFGYSCMLEACHRGYIVVARSLLKSPQMDLSYIPREEESLNSPFASAPNQSALAEAARCGFFKVVQVRCDTIAVVAVVLVRCREVEVEDVVSFPIYLIDGWMNE
jgi:ankyrin repeat protein